MGREGLGSLYLPRVAVPSYALRSLVAKTLSSQQAVHTRRLPLPPLTVSVFVMMEGGRFPLPSLTLSVFGRTEGGRVGRYVDRPLGGVVSTSGAASYGNTGANSAHHTAPLRAASAAPG